MPAGGAQAAGEAADGGPGCLGGTEPHAVAHAQEQAQVRTTNLYVIFGVYESRAVLG